MPSQEKPTGGKRPVDLIADYGHIVSVLVWLLLAATVISVVSRIATKHAASRRFTSDDLLIAIALLFSIAQSVAVSIQVWNGLGRHNNVLTPLQLDRFQQSAYVSDLSFIFNLSFAKLSILLLLRKLTPSALHRKTALVLGAVITLWGAIAAFTVAFQCNFPTPWRFIGNACINRTAFWNSFGTFNILSDLALVFLSLATTKSIEINKPRQAVIAGSFAARSLVTPAIITSLVYLNRSSNYHDQTFNTWPVVLANQIVQNLGIITACIPYLKPFLGSLDPGMVQTDGRTQRGADGESYRCGVSGKQESATTLSVGNFLSRSGKAEAEGPGLSVTTLVTPTEAGHDGQSNWDAESQKSSSTVVRDVEETGG